MGDGLGKQANSEVKTNKNIEKATSLLDEQSREEKSGFKAEISDTKKDKLRDSKLSDKKGGKSGRKSEEDNYEDEFEEIDEDLPDNEPEMEYNMGLGENNGEMYGITVSQSLGIDPSVDSLALEDYDHVEPIEKIDN